MADEWLAGGVHKRRDRWLERIHGECLIKRSAVVSECVCMCVVPNSTEMFNFASHSHTIHIFSCGFVRYSAAIAQCEYVRILDTHS